MRNKLLSLLSILIGSMSFAPLEDKVTIKSGDTEEFLIYINKDRSTNSASKITVKNCDLTLPQLEAIVNSIIPKLNGSCFDDRDEHLTIIEIDNKSFNCFCKPSDMGRVNFGGIPISIGIIEKVFEYMPTKSMCILDQFVTCLRDEGLTVSPGPNRVMTNAPGRPSKSDEWTTRQRAPGRNVDNTARAIDSNGTDTPNQGFSLPTSVEDVHTEIDRVGPAPDPTANQASAATSALLPITGAAASSADIPVSRPERSEPRAKSDWSPVPSLPDGDNTAGGDNVARVLNFDSLPNLPFPMLATGANEAANNLWDRIDSDQNSDPSLDVCRAAMRDWQNWRPQDNGVWVEKTTNTLSSTTASDSSPSSNPGSGSDSSQPFSSDSDRESN